MSSSATESQGVKRLDVALVSAEKVVWHGDASFVIARTVEGEVGFLPDHMPFMAVMQSGAVEIRTLAGQVLLAAVPKGFISVANNRVSILAEHAELGQEIDAAEARRDLEEVQAGDTEAEDYEDRLRLAEARVRAATS
jgi:F-type H+-transporting ATPase subunit epsilon